MKFSVERRSSILSSMIHKAEELDLDFRDDVILAESVPFFEISDQILAAAWDESSEYESIIDDLNNDYYDLITDAVTKEIGFSESDAMEMIDNSINGINECFRDIRKHTDDPSEALADLLCAWLMDCEFDLEQDAGQQLMHAAWDMIMAD